MKELLNVITPADMEGVKSSEPGAWLWNRDAAEGLHGMEWSRDAPEGLHGMEWNRDAPKGCCNKFGLVSVLVVLLHHV